MNNTKSTSRITWLALLRGLNILLVVMYHVQLVDRSTGENHIFCNAITAPLTPIRMPLFIFLSGGLLYLSRIRKGWQTKQLYIDKIERIFVPFLFFVAIYYIIKAVLNPFVKTKVDISLCSFLESYIIYDQHPSAPLWFLATLMTLMLMYPLFQWLCKSSYSVIGFFCLSFAFYFVDISEIMQYNYFNILKINHYLVYFFGGIMFFRLKLYEPLYNIKLSIASIFLYIILYNYRVEVLSSFAGIIAMCSIAMFISEYVPNLFSSFRDNIYQVYLLSLIFQAFVELILWKKLFYNEQLFILFYIGNVMCGIYGAMFVTRIVQRSPYRWLRMCFGLK